MTEISSKDFTDIQEDLASKYGCYGLTTASGFAIWCDQFQQNNRKDYDKLLDGCMMILNSKTERMTLWSIKALWPNEDGGIIS